jgi:DNA invertase Pin-like site-specific DNA recombinase
VKTYPNHALTYYRVSTAQQSRSGLGLDAQRERVQTFCDEYGLTLLAERTEVETGKGADALERHPVLGLSQDACR